MVIELTHVRQRVRTRRREPGLAFEGEERGIPWELLSGKIAFSDSTPQALSQSCAYVFDLDLMVGLLPEHSSILSTND
jgi:hypothetical protein